jgi:hypothetical protein
VSDRVTGVAAALVRYLEEHPNAADTEDGIGRWWLEPGSATAAEVSSALERLIRAGSVERTQVGARLVFRARRSR